jgi:apyrase
VAKHFIPQAKYKDPCTPRGFTHMAGAVNLPASVLEPKVEYRPFAHAVGNFSECRSSALTLLQKGKGSHLLLYHTISHFPFFVILVNASFFN